MIVVDSSALIAIVLKEAQGDKCIDALSQASSVVISAVVLAEVSVVASCRGFADDLNILIGRFGFEVIPANHKTAEQVTFAYMTWGKGRHRAALNFVDCFSYALAKNRDCPLLFVGNDFSQTDIRSVL